jgi:hypothetical protein
MPFPQKLYICHNYSPEIYNELEKIGLCERGLGKSCVGAIIETPKDSREV